MAQKQIAPTTQIIRMPIRSETITIPLLPGPGPRQANVTISKCKIISGPRNGTVISFDSSLDVAPVATPKPRRPQFAPRAGAVTLLCLSHLPVRLLGMCNPDVFQTKADDRYCSIPKMADARHRMHKDSSRHFTHV